MLRSKRPPAPEDTRIVPFPDQSSPVCVTSESVLAAIKFSAGSSSGGVDRLCNGYIRDLLSMDANEPGYRLLNSIYRLPNHIVKRNLSHWSQAELFTSSLTAFRKKDGAIRPISVGNVVRRIASKHAEQSVHTSLGTAPPSTHWFQCSRWRRGIHRCNPKIY